MRTRPKHPPNSSPGAAGVPGSGAQDTWSELQPKVTLRYKPTDDRTLYVGYSRGFRSGGFNQTGVGAERPIGIAGINDLFDEETADTYEAGFKGELAGELALNSQPLLHSRRTATSSSSRRQHQHAEPRQPRRVEYKGLEVEIERPR